MRHEHHAAQLNNISSVATIVSFPCYRSRTGSIDGVGAQRMNTYLVEWLDRMKWRGERGCGPNNYNSLREGGFLAGIERVKAACQGKA